LVEEAVEEKRAVLEERREGETGCAKESRRTEGRPTSTASIVLQYKCIMTLSPFGLISYPPPPPGFHLLTFLEFLIADAVIKFCFLIFAYTGNVEGCSNSITHFFYNLSLSIYTYIGSVVIKALC
jgi:hypothetical protein